MEDNLFKTIVICLSIVSVIITPSYLYYDYNLSKTTTERAYNDCYNSCDIIYRGGDHYRKYKEIECERQCLALLNKSIDYAISERGEVC